MGCVCWGRVLELPVGPLLDRTGRWARRNNGISCKSAMCCILCWLALVFEGWAKTWEWKTRYAWSRGTLG